MKYEIKGFDVYVGRNNRQNDYIISKLAKMRIIGFTQDFAPALMYF